jgi:hypothetical protein
LVKKIQAETRFLSSKFNKSNFEQNPKGILQRNSSVLKKKIQSFQTFSIAIFRDWQSNSLGNYCPEIIFFS